MKSTIVWRHQSVSRGPARLRALFSLAPRFLRHMFNLISFSINFDCFFPVTISGLRCIQRLWELTLSLSLIRNRVSVYVTFRTSSPSSFWLTSPVVHRDVSFGDGFAFSIYDRATPCLPRRAVYDLPFHVLRFDRRLLRLRLHSTVIPGPRRSSHPHTTGFVPLTGKKFR